MIQLDPVTNEMSILPQLEKVNLAFCRSYKGKDLSFMQKKQYKQICLNKCSTCKLVMLYSKFVKKQKTQKRDLMLWTIMYVCLKILL